MSKFKRFVAELRRRGYSQEAAEAIAREERPGSLGTVQELKRHASGRDRRVRRAKGAKDE